MPREAEISEACVHSGRSGRLACAATGCLQIRLKRRSARSRVSLLLHGNHRDRVRHGSSYTAWLNDAESLARNLDCAASSRSAAAQVQERIASILSAYDDLIENNRRRIALLEEAARLLYREWFVHLRFPGHEHVRIVDGVAAPDEWRNRY